MAKENIMLQIQYCLIKHGCNDMEKCLNDIEAVIDGKEIIQIPETDKETPLSKYNLSSRLNTCFKRERIFNVAQLKAYIAQDRSFLKSSGKSLSIRNFGKGLQEEIYEKIPGIKKYCNKIKKIN